MATSRRYMMRRYCGILCYIIIKKWEDLEDCQSEWEWVEETNISHPIVTNENVAEYRLGTSWSDGEEYVLLLSRRVWDGNAPIVGIGFCTT